MGKKPVKAVEAWVPPNPRSHPLYKRLDAKPVKQRTERVDDWLYGGAVNAPVQFERLGRATIATIRLRLEHGRQVEYFRQKGVAIRELGEAEDPKVGRLVALQDAFERAQAKLDKRKLKREARKMEEEAEVERVSRLVEEFLKGSEFDDDCCTGYDGDESDSPITDDPTL